MVSMHTALIMCRKTSSRKMRPDSRKIIAYRLCSLMLYKLAQMAYKERAGPRFDRPAQSAPSGRTLQHLNRFEDYERATGTLVPDRSAGALPEERPHALRRTDRADRRFDPRVRLDQPDLGRPRLRRDRRTRTVGRGKETPTDGSSGHRARAPHGSTETGAGDRRQPTRAGRWLGRGIAAGRTAGAAGGGLRSTWLASANWNWLSCWRMMGTTPV